MINMIRADFYRIFRGKVIYIALAAMLLMIGLSIYMVQPGSIVGNVSVGSTSTMESDISLEMSVEELQSMSVSDYRKLMIDSKDYKLDKDILRSNMNLYYIFIFVAALAVTADFSVGSVKNTLSSAISRNKYFASKVVFINLCSLILFFLNTYISYFANLIFNNRNLASSIAEVTAISIRQLPPILALINFLSGIAFIAKKTSIYNTIAIPLVVVFQLLLSFAVPLFSINEKYADYELQIMINKLVSDYSHSYMFKCYILCAGVIIVFNMLGYMSFKKTEIK